MGQVNYLMATIKLFIYLSSALVLAAIVGILAACKLKVKNEKEDLKWDFC